MKSKEDERPIRLQGVGYDLEVEGIRQRSERVDNDLLEWFELPDGRWIILQENDFYTGEPGPTSAFVSVQDAEDLHG